MDHHDAAQQPAQYYQLQEAKQEKADRLQHQQQTYEPYQPHHSGTGPAAGPTILSVTRGVALGVVAVTLFLLLTVIGLSAGLGVSQRDLRQVKSELGAVQAALSSVVANAPTATLPTPTTAASSATAIPTAVVSDVQCPQVNGTIYTASTGGKRFRRMCGIDYGGEGEAVDIGNVKTLNMDACIDACASRANCTGAGWGVIKGDQGPTHSCWMKANLTKSHTATPEWGFAVLVQQEEEVE